MYNTLSTYSHTDCVCDLMLQRLFCKCHTAKLKHITTEHILLVWPQILHSRSNTRLPRTTSVLELLYVFREFPIYSTAHKSHFNVTLKLQKTTEYTHCLAITGYIYV